MTAPYLDAYCLLMTLFPDLPSAMAALTYEQARYSQPHAGFRADGEAMLPEPCAPVPAGGREARDAA
ncbi:hypothetical protein [Streptomyces sp. SAI-090]|uniref:hypothetical protein n=1 Tax=Streptomyces sp. SAI-090 TaxID=2940545 RepID=UPI00247338BB|nr:hypothetical protein [Streptomyces sp. SAI-090]MDH6522359.1 hypothetical protein [Streptomyces sp. SAI-090]